MRNSIDPTAYIPLSAADFEPELNRWLSADVNNSSEADQPDQANGVQHVVFLREQVTSILRGRALRVTSKGTRRELSDETNVWQYALESEEGKQLRAQQPELFGCWQGIVSLLHDAARRDGTASIEIVLRSHAKHAKPLLKLLAERHSPVPRKELREKLNIEESQMSHLLADMEEASLVRRVRLKGMKEVAIELDWAGREAIDIPEIEETATLKDKVDQLTKQVLKLEEAAEQRGHRFTEKIDKLVMYVQRVLKPTSSQPAVHVPIPSVAQTISMPVPAESGAEQWVGTPAYMGPEQVMASELMETRSLASESRWRVPQATGYWQPMPDAEARAARSERAFAQFNSDELIDASDAADVLAERHPGISGSGVWQGGLLAGAQSWREQSSRWQSGNRSDPWERFENLCRPGQQLTAFVHSFTDSGATVILEPGLEGQLISQRLVKDVEEDKVVVGQPIEVRVRTINKDERKLIVSLATDRERDSAAFGLSAPQPKVAAEPPEAPRAKVAPKTKPTKSTRSKS